MRWQIVETNIGERHFLGYEPRFDSARLSTPIVRFDPQRQCGVTQSGRVYHLVGEPGYGIGADFLLLHLMAAWQLTSHFVTDEVMASGITPH